MAKTSQANDKYAWHGVIGSGEYGNSLGKQTTITTDPVKDEVLEVVKSIPFPDKEAVFNIGDYGTADGAASMVFIRDLIVTLKEHHGPHVQFQIIYEDQETNDFSSLFKRLLGTISDPPSYLQELDNVYVLASGTEFRRQCVPSNSMHFIMSMTAVHWLSTVPVAYKESLYIYPKSNEEEKKALFDHAKKDWETFLLMRSKELKQGGILLVVTGNSTGDDVNDEPTFTLKSCFYILTDIWISFKDCGRITEDEFLNTNFPVHFYSLKELKTPLEDTRSEVYKSGLRLLSSKATPPGCVFYSAWKEKMDQTGIDDREEFARNYVKAHRNWSRFTFFRGLSDFRTQQEKNCIVEELYHLAEKKISEMQPEQLGKDMIHTCLVIRKD